MRTLNGAVALAVVLGSGCKSPQGPHPGHPIPDRDRLFSFGFHGDQMLEGDGGLSGVQDGLIVDPEAPLLIEGLHGNDCAESMVFSNTLRIRRTDDTWVTSLPLRPGTKTLGPEVENRVSSADGSTSFAWPGASFLLADTSDPTSWTVEAMADTLCTRTNGGQTFDCSPNTLELRVDLLIEAPGESQATLADAMQYFDVVPSPDWTFEGIDLPPCVPRLK